MNNKTTVIVAAIVFALVGTLVFAAIAPYLSAVHATTVRLHDSCGPNNDGEPPCGGGGVRLHDSCGPNNDNERPPCGPPLRVK